MVDLMKVFINNKEDYIPNNITVSKLLIHKNIKAKTSVWVNDRHLLLREYETFVIHENDVLKIITVIGGG